ncbi:glycoside hydrolase family 18 protein [Kibdelosporangium lantanae]
MTWFRRGLIALGVLVLVPVLAAGGTLAWLAAEGEGTVPAARGSGSDAMWLGHAWVDGRKTQSDVDDLVNRVRTAGIRDLYVHSGPLASDGTLDPALRPRAKWFVGAVHQAVPGVRVQAWLGTVVGPLDPEDPVATHQIEPLPGLHVPFGWVLVRAHFWSTGYLAEIARNVDQVAIMAYDSGMPFETAYTGYIREQTRLALDAAPESVTVLIGIPAYHTDEPGHTGAETVAAALCGVRLAVGDQAPRRPFGVAYYVDFAATPGDWAGYLSGWARSGSHR